MLDPEVIGPSLPSSRSISTTERYVHVGGYPCHYGLMSIIKNFLYYPYLQIIYYII